MMRFELVEPEWTDEESICFELIEGTGELINLLDEKRLELGFTDLVRDIENDVYYDFYLEYCPNKKFEVWGGCNHGEKDDWHSYDIVLSAEDAEELKKLADIEYAKVVELEEEERTNEEA